jgi:hypothetical protein
MKNRMTKHDCLFIKLYKQLQGSEQDSGTWWLGNMLPLVTFHILMVIIRQFKQREKQLLKVVTVNLPLYKQL